MGRNVMRNGVVSAGVAIAMLHGVGHAQQPSLDELLNLEPEQGEREAAEEAEDEEAPPAEEPQPTELAEPEFEGVDPGGIELDEEVERMLSREEAADAFAEAVRQMEQVSRRLGERHDAGLQTQREQESILAKLEQVIDAASNAGGGGGGAGESGEAREGDVGGSQVAQRGQQEGQGGGGEGQQQGEGEHDGSFSPGTAADAELEEQSIEELRREWGQLPPRLRDEISEGLNERFSPVYRAVTEAYYERLAEEENEQ